MLLKQKSSSYCVVYILRHKRIVTKCFVCPENEIYDTIVNDKWPRITVLGPQQFLNRNKSIAVGFFVVAAGKGLRDDHPVPDVEAL